jgi:hypothetical protein
MLSTYGASGAYRGRHSALDMVAIMLCADRPEIVTGYVTTINQMTSATGC